MQRIFIMTAQFDKKFASLDLYDTDLKALQNDLLTSPSKGDVIQGTGGLRKLRYAREGRGKSGDARIIYLDMPSQSKIILIAAFGKNEQSNLTQQEKNMLKALVAQLKSIYL